MDFVTVEGRALKHALRILLEAVDRRRTIPILGYVKLTLTKDGLRLEATDLDVWVTTLIDVIDGDRAGGWSFCLPAQALAAMAQVAGVMPLRIEPGDRATITLGDGEAIYTLPPLSASDFPDAPLPRGELIERFGNGRLVAHLDKVRAFISREEVRYYLNGAAWQRGAFGSRFAATDGHRMAVCRYDREAVELAATRIIPHKAVSLLVKHFAGRDVAAFAAADGRLGIVFESERLTLATKLIDGTYPDIDKIIEPCIERAKAFTLALKRPEALAAVERLQVFGRDIGRAIRFDRHDDCLVMARSGGDEGARVRTSSPWPEGLGAFGINAVYFGDVIAACASDITLGLASPGDPLLVSDGDAEMTRVLMPMRV
jgi:DNA polymerase-3 subunit beta